MKKNALLFLIIILPFALYAQQAISPLLKTSLQGNWFKTDGSNEWKISFIDSAMIYKSQVWNYTVEPDIKGKFLMIKFNDDKAHKIIYAKAGANGNYGFGENIKQLETYSQIPVYKTSYLDKEVFKLPLLKRDSVMYSGYIKGYSAKMGFKTGRIQTSDVITGSRDSYVINVKPDGAFFVKFPMNYPNALYVSFPGYDKTIFFEPGKDLFHMIDLSDPDKSSLFMGGTASINSDVLALGSMTSINYNDLDRDVAGFSPDRYKKYLTDKETSILAKVKAYQAEKGISKKAYQITELDVKYHVAALKEQYSQKVSKANPAMPDSAYFAFVSALPVDDQVSLISSNYKLFLSHIRTARFVLSDKFVSKDIPYEEIFAQVLKEDDFSDDDIALMNAFIAMKKKATSVNDQSIKDFDAQFPEPKFSDFLKAHRENFEKAANDIVERKRFVKMKRVYNLKTDFIPDLFYAQEKYDVLSSFNVPFSANQLLNIKSRIANPFIFAEVNRVNEELKVKQGKTQPKAVVVSNNTGQSISAVAMGNKIEKSDSEDLFVSMMKKYKGKVVLVDFWATWCLPCLDIIKEIVPLKQELAKEDVVFVYVTNQTSPVDIYNKMIGEIKGEHFRLSNDEWNHLSAKFNITGIPHQVLVDRKGALVNSSLRHANNAALKDILMQHVNK